MRRCPFLFVLLLIAACHRTPDEERIRQAITAMQSAVQARDPRAFMAYVDADFTGNGGQADREGLHNLLRVQVLRNAQIGVTLGTIDVELQGDRAIVHVTATIYGGSGGLLPERGAVYDITSGWKREGSAWRCYNANWSQQL